MERKGEPWTFQDWARALESSPLSRELLLRMRSRMISVTSGESCSCWGVGMGERGSEPFFRERASWFAVCINTSSLGGSWFLK